MSNKPQPSRKKPKKIMIKVYSDKRLEYERMSKWRKFGKRYTEKRGEWSRQRLEFLLDFDTRVYKLGLKLINENTK